MESIMMLFYMIMLFMFMGFIAIIYLFSLIYKLISSFELQSRSRTNLVPPSASVEIL